MGEQRKWTALIWMLALLPQVVPGECSQRARDVRVTDKDGGGVFTALWVLFSFFFFLMLFKKS